MSKVAGKNVVLSIFDGGFYKPAACALDVTIAINTTTIASAVTGAGVWETFEPARHSWSASINGLVNLEGINMLSLADLQAFQITMTKLLIRYERTAADGKVYTNTGYAIITDSTDTGSHAGMDTFSITLKGTGPLTQSFVPSPINPPGTMHSFYINDTGAETGAVSYTNAAYAGKTIIGAWRQIDQTVITTGSPAINQVLYDISTGTFSWLTPLDPDEQIHIQYQDI